MPLLRSWREEGLRVSTTVLIDDTQEDRADVSGRAEWIFEAAQTAGLEVDYAVNESACAHSLDQMLAAFFPLPETAGGELGSSASLPVVDPVFESHRWLANGEPGRGRPGSVPLRLPGVKRSAKSDAAASPRRTGSRGTRAHSIHMDVELWSLEGSGDGTRSAVWSCPLLASWWQLLRLGVPVETSGGLPLRPAPRTSAPAPFAAQATLTVLPPSFIAVEHAVQSILSRVALPREWREHWDSEGGAPGFQEANHVDRISYLFAGRLPSAAAG